MVLVSSSLSAASMTYFATFGDVRWCGDGGGMEQVYIGLLNPESANGNRTCIWWFDGSNRLWGTIEDGLLGAVWGSPMTTLPAAESQGFFAKAPFSDWATNARGMDLCQKKKKWDQHTARSVRINLSTREHSAAASRKLSPTDKDWRKRANCSTPALAECQDQKLLVQSRETFDMNRRLKPFGEWVWGIF